MEFAWYRDVHFLYQLALEDTATFFRGNLNCPRTWTTVHGGVLPFFQFINTDRDKTVAAMRASIGDWRTGTKLSPQLGRPVILLPRPILPNFPVLARACLRCLERSHPVLTLPSTCSEYAVGT